MKGLVEKRWRVPGGIFLVSGALGAAAVLAVIRGAPEGEIALLGILALAFAVVGFIRD